MADGRTIQITKQIGEYLVAAELGRHGFVAATFSANVPGYDIVATDRNFKSVVIQVKASNGNSWQLNISHFVNISMKGKKQELGRPVLRVRKVVFVMVALSSYGNDRFYVVKGADLQRIVVRDYRGYLKSRGGIRKTTTSHHTVVEEEELVSHKDKWKVIGKGF